MINIKEIELDNLKQYDNIEFKYTTNKIYELKKINKGLGGFLLEVKNVEIFTKEFKEKTTDWKQYFDLKKWKVFIAYDNDIPVGGAVLAVRKDQINGEEHSILWDIRVIEKYKHQGIGQMLFDKIKEEAKLL